MEFKEIVLMTDLQIKLIFNAFLKNLTAYQTNKRANLNPEKNFFVR